jgi:hypothetical protein
MNYLIIILCVAFFTGCETNSALKMKPKTVSKSLHQSINGDVDLKHLTETSNVIIVGELEEIRWVVNEERFYLKQQTSDNGIVSLPNIKDGVKGVLVKVRVAEVLYKETDKTIESDLDIYVKDGYFPPSDADIPVFLPNKKYLIFLSTLKGSDDFKTFSVIRPKELSKGGSLFDFKSVFKVTDNKHGNLIISDTNKHFIDEVRKFIAK